MGPPNRKVKVNRKTSFSGKKKHQQAEEKPIATCNLTEEEQALFAEFRHAVQDAIRPYYDDKILLRFLTAKSFNVKEAEKLFRLDANCRRILMVENILEDYVLPEVNVKYDVTGMIGFDKEGAPVRVLNLGNADFKGFVGALSTIELIKIFLYFMEKDAQSLREENERAGRQVDQYVYIVNLEDFSMNQLLYKPVLDTGLLGLKLFQEHFFDVPKTVFVINAPSFFSSAYKLFKPVIQDSLQKKIKVFGYDNWKEVLQKHIDAEILPVFLGGTRVDCDNDPRCSAFIGFGGQIPEEYHTSQEHLLDPDDPEVVTAMVPAGSFLNVRVTVKEPGTTIKWHIQAKDNDVGIAVYYEPISVGCETPRTKKKNEDKHVMSRLEQLSPVIRSQCHIRPEIGYAVTWKSGVHIVHFDNSYSWLSAKQVFYKIQTKPPATEVGAKGSDTGSCSNQAFKSEKENFQPKGKELYKLK